ncbi:uncharacterized protein PHLOEM PROTEIN 2-LIKE A7-like [Eutrema salsugineum]|uniref:uncharacterized protein PHLOEM PROTEIN 2-LIKE A7-like n=1 Tax=Eutrema salsugineum TaxID=72664 RepID=UPI000CED3F01|nr:uncharacterized protein PHLOEM PROTEIN 2-LIKE A7-like [Eutrema salsugineum]
MKIIQNIEMGDLVLVVQKESTPTSIQCPMLTSTNYTVWAMRMRVLLRINKVWEEIEPGSTDANKKDIATGLLFQAVPENLILQVGEQESPKGIWDAIKARNLGADRVKEARLQTLMSDFERLKMKKPDTIDRFTGKLSELASKAASLGKTIEETKLVSKFLNSLPRNKFIHIVASLEQVLDLKTTSFEDIIGRLKAYEERISDSENHEETQGKLLYANSEQQTRYGSRGRGRGRRGRGNRGRGRGGRFNSKDQSTNQNDQSQGKENKDRPKIICY